VTGLLAILSGATAFAGFWAHRPAPARVRALVLEHATVRSRPARSPAVRRLGAGALATAATLVVWPPLAPAAGLAAWAVPIWRARRRRAVASESAARALPEVVDLFGVAVGAGLTVPLAVAAVAPRAGEPFASALHEVTVAVEAGRRCGDALDAAAGRLGPAARPLLDALRASDRYGAPLVDALVRIGAEVRADRRRRAEAAVRRVPVRLLFPLVICILPAFALLTVAPLLAGTLGSLRL
jgi:tight adherence protein C